MKPLRPIGKKWFPLVSDRTVTLILVPLILVPGSSEQEPTFAITREEKFDLLSAKTENDSLVAVWTGKNRSDAFAVDEKTLRQWRLELGIE